MIFYILGFIGFVAVVSLVTAAINWTQDNHYRAGFDSGYSAGKIDGHREQMKVVRDAEAVGVIRVSRPPTICHGCHLATCYGACMAPVRFHGDAL